MSRQSLELAQPPRVLASAIGVALTAFSAPSIAQSVPDTTAARGDAPVALDELTVIGEQEQSYKADTSASKKYTAPVRVRAATRRVTGRSFAASTPRATPLSMACVMSARKPARSSTSSASR